MYGVKIFDCQVKVSSSANRNKSFQKIYKPEIHSARDCPSNELNPFDHISSVETTYHKGRKITE